MRHVLGGLLWVLLLAPYLVCCQTCTPNNTVLTGSNFEFAAAVTDGCGDYPVPLFKQRGALYSLPELRVVANTTVTFNITYSTVNLAALPFGLTLSPSSVTVSSGDALGLTPTADSVSAGACRAFPETGMINNTFAHNYTRQQYTVQPCVLTWQVPLPNANYNYSYFVYDSGTPSPPRRIYIVNSTDVPSSSSSSSSSSAVPGPSSSSSASSSGSSLPVSSSTSGTGTGSSSTPTLTPASSSSSSGSGTGTGTGSSPSLSSSSIGTSSSSSSSSSPNGAGASVNAVYGAVAVVVAVIFTMVSA